MRYRSGDRVTIGGDAYRLGARLGTREWIAQGPKGERAVSEAQFDVGCSPERASVERGAGSNLDRAALEERARDAGGPAP